MKKRNNTEGQINFTKEALRKANEEKDMLDILGGSDEEKAAVADKVKKLEDKLNELEGNTPIPVSIDPPTPEPSTNPLSLEEKITILEDNINYFQEKRELLSKQMDNILERIDLAKDEIKKDLQDNLINLDAEKSEIEQEIKKANCTINSLKSAKKRLEEIDADIEESEKRVKEFYQKFKMAKALNNDSDKSQYADAIRSEDGNKKLLKDEKEQILATIEKIDVKPAAFVEEMDENEDNKYNKVILWLKDHGRLFIAIAILFLLLIAIIIAMNCCVGVNNANSLKTTVPTTTHSTKVQPTTVEPTTVQPTTVQSTTSKPKEEKVEKSNSDEGSDDSYYENYYTPERQEDTNYYTGDNSDMKTDNHPNDSSSENKDQNGASITYGGNEGYGASISSDKESPVPEEKFEEEHPLPPTVSQEEIDNAPVVDLTPAS